MGKKENKKSEESQTNLSQGAASRLPLQEMLSMFDSYVAAKQNTVKLWKQIKSFYDGVFWDSFKTKVKEYTITPDTNYIEYVVTAYINSIYSGVFVPEIRSTDLDQDKDAAMLNAFIEIEWVRRSIKKEFVQWGENITLYNMQPILFSLYNDKVKFEAESPFSVSFDPSVSDYRKGQAVFINKEVNINVLKRDERFKETLKSYIEMKQDGFVFPVHIKRSSPDDERFETTGNKTVSIIRYFIRSEEGIDEGYILNNEFVLYEKKNILPEDEFPMVVLFQRKPSSNPYGKPMISKIINSYIALNLLDSMDATQPYLAQHRPRFFDLRSRINARDFKDYGNVPNSFFPMFGEPTKAIHYQDIQVLPDTTMIKARLEKGIFDVTGVDMAYKGRATNSITTTGGIEAQQARVVMLTDNSIIVGLEAGVEELAKMFVKFHVEFVDKVKTRKNNFVQEKVELVFKKIKQEELIFKMEAKPYLPMTREVLFETLVRLYEMQGQYHFQIPLIQEEDLIDELPVSATRKAKLLQRVSSDRQANAALKRRETLMTFASLFQQYQNAGLDDDQATDEALKTMDEEEMMMQQDPTLGKNPTGQMPQGGTPGAF